MRHGSSRRAARPSSCASFGSGYSNGLAKALPSGTFSRRLMPLSTENSTLAGATCTGSGWSVGIVGRASGGRAVALTK